MNKNSIIFLLLSAFILVICWILFSIYHNSVTTTVPETITVQVSSIDPNFDTKTLNTLKQRQTVLPDYDAPVTPPSPIPTPSSVLPSGKPVKPTPIKSSPTPTQTGPTPTLKTSPTP
jgi:hypothetical protein